MSCLGSSDQTIAVRQTRGFYALALFEVKTGCININILKQDLAKWREELGVPKTHTVAVGRTDIPGGWKMKFLKVHLQKC